MTEKTQTFVFTFHWQNYSETIEVDVPERNGSVSPARARQAAQNDFYNRNPGIYSFVIAYQSPGFYKAPEYVDTWTELKAAFAKLRKTPGFYALATESGANKWQPESPDQLLLYVTDWERENFVGADGRAHFIAPSIVINTWSEFWNDGRYEDHEKLVAEAVEFLRGEGLDVRWTPGTGSTICVANKEWEDESA